MSAVLRFAKNPDVRHVAELVTIIVLSMAVGAIFGPVLFPGVCR